MSGSNASTARPNDGFGGSSDGDSHPTCRLEGPDKSVGCNHTLYQGHCGHLYSPVDGKWCTHPEENFDLCCAESDTDCCKPSTSWTVAFATFLLLALGCICCMYFYRLVFRFRQSLFTSRRVPENPRRRSGRGPNDPGDFRDNRDVRQTDSASFRRRLPSHEEQEQFELKLRDHIRLVFTDQDDAPNGADGGRCSGQTHRRQGMHHLLHQAAPGGPGLRALADVLGVRGESDWDGTRVPYLS